LDNIKDITAAIDRLVAALRLDQEVRLASVLQCQVHRTAWDNHTDLLKEVSRLLRNAQASQVSSYSAATGAKMDAILASIEGQLA
jgi:hypothetical protein